MAKPMEHITQYPSGFQLHAIPATAHSRTTHGGLVQFFSLHICHGRLASPSLSALILRSAAGACRATYGMRAHRAVPYAVFLSFCPPHTETGRRLQTHWSLSGPIPALGESTPAAGGIVVQTGMHHAITIYGPWPHCRRSHLARQSASTGPSRTVPHC